MCACMYIRTYVCIHVCSHLHLCLQGDWTRNTHTGMQQPPPPIMALIVRPYALISNVVMHERKNTHIRTPHMYAHTQTHTMFHVRTYKHTHTHVSTCGTVHLWVSHTYMRTHVHNIQEQENAITSLNQQVSALEKEKLAAATSTIVRTVRMTPTHSPPTVHARTYQTVSWTACVLRMCIVHTNVWSMCVMFAQTATACVRPFVCSHMYVCTYGQ